MNKFTGIALIVLAVLFFSGFAATVVALLYSFSVQNTLSAVESVFGSLVLTLCFFVLGKKCFNAGKKKLATQINPE